MVRPMPAVPPGKDGTAEYVPAPVGELAADETRRAALAKHGQQLIDGFGALRVGFHVGRLIEAAEDR